MIRIGADWLDAEPAQRLCRVLEEGGHLALFVGGCVRNAMLHIPATDIDLATDARPPRVIELMEGAGLKVAPTGIDHGTVTVVIDHQPFEVTTFRRDIETDGRRAVVHDADTPLEDAKRRDFTMNALYCDREGSIVDPLGGLADLQAGRLRFVGDPDSRVQEDYLRILRFFRFTAWYADPDRGMDADGLGACARHAAGLEGISAERITAELRKLLSAPDPGPAVAAMEQAGVLRVILPGATAHSLPALVHLEAEPDPVVRLAVLGGDPGAHLRLSRAEARRLDALKRAAREDEGPAALGYRLGAADGFAACALRGALTAHPLPPGAAEEAARGAQAEFPVSARDLMGEAQGPDLGRRLKALERRWIESGFRLSREDLLA